LKKSKLSMKNLLLKKRSMTKKSKLKRDNQNYQMSKLKTSNKIKLTRRNLKENLYKRRRML